MGYIAFPTFDAFPLRKKSKINSNRVKTVGILGGMAPQSTHLFYDLVVQQCLKEKNATFPRMIINSVNSAEVIEILDQKDLSKLYLFLRAEIERMQSQVDFVVMVCNSIHAVYKTLQTHLEVPILSIYEEVCKEIAISNTRKVGIIGTQTTVKQQFYQYELARYGINYAVLPEQMDHAIDRCIFEEIVLGKENHNMQNLLLEAIQYFEDHSCEGVIMACTELPLFITQKDTNMPLFLSTQLLAQATVERCFQV